jgi:hypothetical protein
MKRIVVLSLYLMVTFVFFNGCRRGEDDPFISFRSRKARVTGKWKMTSYKTTYNHTESFGFTTEIFTGNGSTYTFTDLNSFGTNFSKTGTFTYEITFKKDGSYTGQMNQDGEITNIEGKWNFTRGVGDIKDKSQITLYETSYKDRDDTNTSTGHYFNDTYDLKELRNNKMVWYRKYTDTRNSRWNSYSHSEEVEIVFEAK